MISLDGIDYQVKSPDENLDDLVTYINEYCASHNVKNSHGETIFIDANEANPLYQVLRGYAYTIAVMQKLIYSAGCSFSIAESSERQLLNLADIAGVKRNAPTHTIISGTAYSTDDVCNISTEAEATVIVSGEEVVFHPAYSVSIPANSSAYIILVADRTGPISLSENTITNFDEPIANLQRLITNASTPGQNMETVADLRERIQRRRVSNTQIERAANAIQELEGVAMCNIHFNYNSEDPELVPYGDTTISLPARQALLVVQGWSTEANAIARTFYRYLICQTGGSDVPGVRTQVYTTKANQDLTVYIVPPVQIPIYIKVYTNDVLSDYQIASIQYTVCAIAGRLTIGQSLSSATVIQAILETFPSLQLQGVELSKDDVSYSYEQQTSPLSVFSLSIDRIQVIGANT